MKLKNKLLPLIGTAAIAATATPLALTSCSSGLELIDITDGSKAIPTINPMEASWMGQKDWTTAYVKACKENPEIFRQDFIYGVYDNKVMRKWDNETINYLKVGVSKPTFGTVNVSYPSEPDVIYPTISFSYEIQYSKDQNIVESSSYVDISTVKTVKATLTNVPFIIDGTTTQVTQDPVSYKTEYWFDIPDMRSKSYVWKFNLNSWSIDYSYTENKTETYVTQSGKNVTENTQSDSGTLKSYADLASDPDILYPLEFGFYSNYLSAVSMVPEFSAYKMYAGENTNDGAIHGSLSTGISSIRGTDTTKTETGVNGYLKGLYLPAQETFGLYSTKDLSVSVFADYDAEGNKTAIVLPQVLPEGSTATQLYLNIPTTAQKFSSDGSYTIDGKGWAATNTVYYEGSSYFAYQFPESKFYSDAACTTTSALMPTTTTAANREAFTFELPKYIWVQFSHPSLVDPTETVTWDQQVWLSQDEMTVYGYFD